MALADVAEKSWIGTAASVTVTLLGLSIAVTMARIGLGMLRAYYTLRVRAGTCRSPRHGDGAEIVRGEGHMHIATYWSITACSVVQRGQRIGVM